LNEGKFITTTIPFADEDTLTSHLFSDLSIDLQRVFPREETEN